MRILIANTPRMYRESLALSIQRERPHFEVLLTAPENVDQEVERLAPHALVRDDDGLERWSMDGVICWAGIIIDNHLNARISVDGRISEIHDVSFDEFLAALDEAHGLISKRGQGTPPTTPL